jgi:hypothetical protein
MTVNRPGHARGRAAVRPAVVQKAATQPFRHAAAPLRRSVAEREVESLNPAALTLIACIRC